MILLICLCVISILSMSQKITYSDLVMLANKPQIESIEHLMGKGFVSERALSGDKTFVYKVGEEEINITFSHFSYDAPDCITVSFSQKFDKEFKAIESYVKTHLKKTRFFRNEDKIYTPEYKFGSKYMYVYRGMTWATKTGFRFGEFKISNAPGNEF